MEEILEAIGGTAGWVIGIGITMGVAAGFSNGAKPLAKKAIKGYLSATDRVRVATAEMGENLQDLYAEARMEYDASRSASNGAVHNGASSPSPIIVPGRGTV